MRTGFLKVEDGVVYNVDLLSIIYSSMLRREMVCMGLVCTRWRLVYERYQWCQVGGYGVSFVGEKSVLKDVFGFFVDGSVLKMIDKNEEILKEGKIDSYYALSDIQMKSDLVFKRKSSLWDFDVKRSRTISKTKQFIRVDIYLSFKRLKDDVSRKRNLNGLDLLFELSMLYAEKVDIMNDDRDFRVVIPDSLKQDPLTWLTYIENSDGIVAKYSPALKWNDLYFNYLEKKITSKNEDLEIVTGKGGILLDYDPTIFVDLISTPTMKSKSERLIDTDATLVICERDSMKLWKKATQQKNVINIYSMPQLKKMTGKDLLENDIIIVPKTLFQNATYFFAYFPTIKRKPKITDLERRIRKIFERDFKRKFKSSPIIALEYMKWHRIIISGNDILSNPFISSTLSMYETTHKWISATSPINEPDPMSLFLEIQTNYDAEINSNHQHTMISMATSSLTLTNE